MISDFVSVRGGGLLALGGRHAFAEGGMERARPFIRRAGLRVGLVMGATDIEALETVRQALPEEAELWSHTAARGFFDQEAHADRTRGFLEIEKPLAVVGCHGILGQQGQGELGVNAGYDLAA